jgi:hypothetical protein
MQSKALIRLVASGIIAFVSYAAWAYYANSLVTNDSAVLIKAAIVQGSYSGAITLFFTFLLEVFYHKFGKSTYCLAFITPHINAHSKTQVCSTLETFKAGLELSERQCEGKCVAGSLLSPLPALAIQSVMVISVNIAFATPNLWLTVAPSIVFSAIYGYSYSLSLAKKGRATAPR